LFCLSFSPLRRRSSPSLLLHSLLTSASFLLLALCPSDIHSLLSMIPIILTAFPPSHRAPLATLLYPFFPADLRVLLIHFALCFFWSISSVKCLPPGIVRLGRSSSSALAVIFFSLFFFPHDPFLDATSLLVVVASDPAFGITLTRGTDSWSRPVVFDISGPSPEGSLVADTSL